jgi:triacylglycerol lipase
MSELVELDRSQYPDDALNRFTPTPHFDIENARAMMWLSQLAYETVHEAKVTDILGAFGLTKRAVVTNDPGTGLPPHSACVIVADGRGATFVAFAGSDPLKFNDWITDFDVMPTPDDLHEGFKAAVELVWPRIEPAIIDPANAGRPVFFTGHSLGGALAILAAARAPNGRPIVAYTFGSPRNGGEQFFNDYTKRLGDSTFRFIDGTDIVPTVPPTILNRYHHVGQAVHCPSGGLFNGIVPMSSNGNDPDFVRSLLQAGIADAAAIAAVQLLPRIGPGLQNLLAGLLPRLIRDHVPANYFRALSITLRPPPP